MHHGPTRGGGDEAKRYDLQYQRTLAAYTAVFDAPPPTDIWPPSERRFGVDLAWRRVNVASNWVVPKPPWLRGHRWRATRLAGLAAVPLVAAGIPNPLDLTGPPFLALFMALVTGSFVAGLVLWRMFQPQGDPTVTGEDLEPLELVLLADDGCWRCAATGLTALAIAPEPPATPTGADAAPAPVIVSEVPAGAPPKLQALHSRLAAIGNCTTVEGSRPQPTWPGTSSSRRSSRGACSRATGGRRRPPG